MQPPGPLDLLHRASRAESDGRFDEARQLLRQAVAAAGEAPVGCDARLRLGKLLVQGGASLAEEALATLDSARDLAARLGASRQQATAVHLLALLRRQQGRFDEADALLDSSPVLRQTDSPGPEVAQWLHYRGLITGSCGELANAERLCLRAHRLYQELHHQQGLAEVCTSLANVLLARGKSRPALAFAHQSLDLKRRLGDRYGEAVTLGTLGRILLLQARYAEAQESLLQDLELTRSLGDVRGAGIVLNGLGEVALRTRRWDEACRSFEESSQADPSPVNTLYALAGLARAHLGAGRLAEAEAVARRLAEHAGLPNESAESLRRAWIDAVQGALTWRRGDAPAGEQGLARAVEALRGHSKALHAVPWEYELRDLYQSEKRMPEAVGVMARALDLLTECGSEQGVRDVEEWLRGADEPALLRLSLSRHVPDHLIDGVLAGGLQTLPPRRQEVAVLFTDVRDYTTLTEQLEPEEVVEILNEWFVEVTRAIRHHGGVVNQFIGDAVMALFGVPEPRGDAAADAVRAALEIRDALAAFNLRRQALGLRTIRIGVGIHAGQAVVGFVGSHLRQTYTAVGDVVNTAARLESLTKELAADILISEQAEEVQQRHAVAETTFQGHRMLKGRSSAIGVFQVTGRRQAPAQAGGQGPR